MDIDQNTRRNYNNRYRYELYNFELIGRNLYLYSYQFFRLCFTGLC
jgi:hypothetical protein